MNKTGRTIQWGTWLIVLASLILCIGVSSTQATTTLVSSVTTTGNNFTMQNTAGDVAPFGGTNDVLFTWDGTFKTAVAVSSQVSNATIGSTCPFFGGTWSAHDVALYGPGTYQVFTGCNPGAPGCGTGPSYTFTVNPGEVAGHMLFDWNGNLNIDVVDIWVQGAYQPSGLFTGACYTTIGANAYHVEDSTLAVYSAPSSSILWDMMSYDWYFFQGLGSIDANGAPMLDGPFSGSFANFNLMAPCIYQVLNDTCNDNNPCTNDACDPTLNKPVGQCVHTNLTNGTACTSDGLACTNDICSSGTCTHTPVVCSSGSCVEPTGCPCCLTLNCNDNNPCTDDNCADTGGGTCACVHTNNTASCNDGNACTVNDTCSGGSCAGTARNCNDNDACTTDTCNTATGCVNAAISCDDNNPCTTDTCNTATGCVYTNICPNDGDLVAPPGVDLADALYALRIVMGIITPTPSEQIHGDVAPCVNGVAKPDGIIDMGDVIVILRKAVGLSTCI